MMVGGAAMLRCLPIWLPVGAVAALLASTTGLGVPACLAIWAVVAVVGSFVQSRPYGPGDDPGEGTGTNARPEPGNPQGGG